MGVNQKKFKGATNEAGKFTNFSVAAVKPRPQLLSCFSPEGERYKPFMGGMHPALILELGL